MAKRPSRKTARSPGLLRAAAILLIALTALVTGPAVWRASAQTDQQIPVIEIESPAQLGADDTTLAGVSQLTFGNQDEASEIFQLNDGRPQQVGGELTSVDQQLEVGWILELPQGASGSLVQFVTVSGSVSPTTEFVQASGSGGTGSMSMATSSAPASASGNQASGSGGTGSMSMATSSAPASSSGNQASGSGGTGSTSMATSSAPASSSGNSGNNSHSSRVRTQTTRRGAAHAATMMGLQFPVFLAEVGGLVVLGLTLLILLWRHAMRGARKGLLGRRLAAWLTGPSRRRREHMLRATLGQAWRADIRSVGAATVALTEAGQLVPPTVQAAVAAEVGTDSVRVFPPPELNRLQSSWADPGATGIWVRPRASEDARQIHNALCRPVRVGGHRGSQLFVDISHCDGTIALTGDPTAASEVLLALLGELARYHRDLTLAVLGTKPAGSVRAQLMRHSGVLAARIGPAAPANDSPVRAAAARREITGIVAVPGDTPVQESIEVARLCALRGSTWLALVVGDVPGAHWRWNVDRAGRMRLPALGRTVVAAL
jgi:hypothetical protein